MTVSIRKARAMFIRPSTRPSTLHCVPHRADPQGVNELFLLVEKIMQWTFHLISVSQIQLQSILLPVRQSELTSVTFRD